MSTEPQIPPHAHPLSEEDLATLGVSEGLMRRLSLLGPFPRVCTADDVPHHYHVATRSTPDGTAGESK